MTGRPECGTVHLRPRRRGANSVQAESGRWVTVVYYHCDRCGADWERVTA